MTRPLTEAGLRRQTSIYRDQTYPAALALCPKVLARLECLLDGLEMAVTNNDVEDPFCSPNSAHGLSKWLEEKRNIGHSEKGGGLKAKKLAHKMSST